MGVWLFKAFKHKSQPLDSLLGWSPHLILEGIWLLRCLMWPVFFMISSGDPSNELPSEKLMLTLHDSLAAHNFQLFGFIQSGLHVPITFMRLSFPSLQWRPCDLFLYLIASNYCPPLLSFIYLYISLIFTLCVYSTSVCLQRLGPILEVSLIWREDCLTLNSHFHSHPIPKEPVSFFLSKSRWYNWHHAETPLFSVRFHR